MAGTSCYNVGTSGSRQGNAGAHARSRLRLSPHFDRGYAPGSARNQTELGKKAQGFMESGNLVPDELVDAIVRERVKRKDCARGFILDGYPRTIPQAEFLDAILTQGSAKPLAMGIQVGDQALVSRLSARWTCPSLRQDVQRRDEPGQGRWALRRMRHGAGAAEGRYGEVIRTASGLSPGNRAPDRILQDPRLLRRGRRGQVGR